MTARSFTTRWIVQAVAATSMLFGVSVMAQGPSDAAALRRDVQARFDVLPLRDGVALAPKSTSARARLIELTGGTIQVDGAAVTGRELEDRLGADAQVVIRLSYMTEGERRALLLPASSALAATPAEPAPVQPQRHRTGSDIVRFGGNVNVGEDEFIDGDIVVLGGSVRVDGQVRGDIVCVGRGITLGPKADVGGDVVSVGGALVRDPSARIAGDVQEVGWGGRRGGRVPVWDIWRGMALGASFALLASVSRVVVLCLLTALVVLLGRPYVERVGARAAADPLKAGAIGFVSQLLFVPLLVATVVALVVTIIGIPLLVLIPFAILGLILVALLGFTGVAIQVGRYLSTRAGWDVGVYAMTVIGILAIVSPLLLVRVINLVFPLTFGLGIVAAIVEYVAWTVGFGAVALTRFSRSSQQTASALSRAES